MPPHPSQLEASRQPLSAFDPTPKGDIACLLQLSPDDWRRNRISWGCSLLLQALLLGGYIWVGGQTPTAKWPPPTAHVEQFWLWTPPSQPHPRPASPPTESVARLRWHQAPQRRLNPTVLMSAASAPLPDPAPHLIVRRPLRRLAWSQPTPVRSPLQLGSFGSPTGLIPVQSPPVRPNMAALGAFASVQTRGSGDAPAGATAGGGGGAGFASVSAAFPRPPSPRFRERIAIRRFGSPQLQTLPGNAVPPAAAASNILPPRILYKPRPNYPALARAQGIQGMVVLEAILRASGTVQVLRIMHGLGDGLDQSARVAAAGIRFLPARLNQQPVDWKVYLYISFRLLD